jgi:phosphatidylglycerophosphate synthase
MVNKIPSTYECPFDIVLLKYIDSHLKFYKELNLTPNIITTISILFSILSAYNIFKGNFKTSTLLFIIAYYFDCVDGKLARKYNMVSKFGDYYDHFSDIFKIVIILYALYKVNKKKYNDIKYFIYSLFLLCLLHLGYQEVIYSSDESPTLSLFKNVAQKDNNPEQRIKLTRFFGCGTVIIVICIIILLWSKE